jgi:ABC-type transporter Mla subunit MlaD
MRSKMANDEIKNMDKTIRASKKEIQPFLDSVSEISNKFKDINSSVKATNTNITKTIRASEAVAKSNAKIERSSKETVSSQKELVGALKEGDKMFHRMNRSLGQNRTIMDDIADYADTWSNMEGFPAIAQGIAKGVGSIGGKGSAIGSMTGIFVKMSKSMQFVGQTVGLLGKVFAPLIQTLSLMGGLAKWLIYLFIGAYENAAKSTKLFSKMTSSVGDFSKSLHLLKNHKSVMSLEAPIKEVAKVYHQSIEEMIGSIESFAESGGRLELTNKGLKTLATSVVMLKSKMGMDLKQAGSFLGELQVATGQGVEAVNELSKAVSRNFEDTGIKSDKFISAILEASSSMGDFGSQLKSNARYLASLKNTTLSSARALEIFRNAQQERQRPIEERIGLSVGFLDTKEGKSLLKRELRRVTKTLDYRRAVEPGFSGKEDELRLVQEQSALKKLLANSSDFGAHSMLGRASSNDAFLRLLSKAGAIQMLTGGKGDNPEAFMEQNANLIEGIARKFFESGQSQTEMIHLLKRFLTKSQEGDTFGSFMLREYHGFTRGKKGKISDEDVKDTSAIGQSLQERMANFSTRMQGLVSSAFPELTGLGGLADSGFSFLEQIVVVGLSLLRKVFDVLSWIYGGIRKIVGSPLFFGGFELPRLPDINPPVLPEDNSSPVIEDTSNSLEAIRRSIEKLAEKEFVVVGPTNVYADLRKFNKARTKSVHESQQ